LTIVFPAAGSSASTTIANVADAPADSAASVQVTVRETSVQPLGMNMTISPAGTWSVSVTADAAPGPLLETPIVKVTRCPTAADDAPTVFVAARSG
jgi:hypothetical protein